MKGVLLAAGPGTELSPLTHDMAKPMLKILGKPLLEYALERFRDNGILDIYVVIREDQINIREYFGNGKHMGMRIKYCYQSPDKPGITGAVLAVKDHLKDSSKFIISHADIICNSSILSRTLNAAEAAGTEYSLAVTLQSDIRNYGVVYLSSDGMVERIGRTSEGGSHYVVAGIFLLSSAIFALLERGMEFNECINELAKSNTIAAGVWTEPWIDIARPWDVLKASSYLLSRMSDTWISAGAYIEDNVDIKGPVIIESGVEILNGSIIKGPVYISKNVFIGNNTLIRDHTEIGENSKIGFQSEIRSSIIMDNVSIAGQSYIGASIIGNHTTIYPSVITTNKHIPPAPIKMVIGKDKVLEVPLEKFGAIIGPHCQIGVRTTLMPGSRVDAYCPVPSNSLIDGHVKK